MHQKHNLVPRTSALTNVIHGAMVRQRISARTWSHTFAPAHVREEAMDWLERVGLADRAMNPASTLSGGQSQRVAIARALMQNPKLVIADEPVASLDPVAGEEVMGLFTELVAVTCTAHKGRTHDSNLQRSKSAQINNCKTGAVHT